MLKFAKVEGRGVADGGVGGPDPRTFENRVVRPPRFENEVAKIRCFFDFRVFWGRLATLPTIRPPPPLPTQKSVATPLVEGQLFLRSPFLSSCRVVVIKVMEVVITKRQQCDDVVKLNRFCCCLPPIVWVIWRGYLVTRLSALIWAFIPTICM